MLYCSTGYARCDLSHFDDNEGIGLKGESSRDAWQQLYLWVGWQLKSLLLSVAPGWCCCWSGLGLDLRTGQLASNWDCAGLATGSLTA